MRTNFCKNEFINDYNKWSKMFFPREKADHDDVYDLRYDLYEVDMNYAGSWIRLVNSDFKDIDWDLDDGDLQLLLNHAKTLRSKVGKSDVKLVDKYISRMEVMLSMYKNYKCLSHD